MSVDVAVHFGLAQRCITPDHEVDLYRFGETPRTSRQVHDDLWVRVLVLEDEAGERTAIVSLDLIWLSRELGDAVRDNAGREFGLKPESILLAATHTHCSPQIRPATFGAGRCDQGYEAFLLARVGDCLREAVASLRPGRLGFGTSASAAAVYRRKRIVDLAALKRLRFQLRVANRPLPGVRHEETLSVLWLYGEDGRPAGVLYNLACHASLFRGEAVSADYPGVVASRMAEKFGPDFVTLFLQGFSGNLRPNLVQPALLSVRHPWRAAYYLLCDRLHFVKEVGEKELDAFADLVVSELLAIEVHPCGPVRLSACWREFPLPLAPLPPREYFAALSQKGSEAEREYGAYVTANYEALATVPLVAQKISLAPKLAIIALEGEVFMEYALWLREMAEKMGMDAMPVGCANGMAGYIPDAKSLEFGGYETDRTLVLYGLPARFAGRVEAIIKKNLAELLAQE